MSMRIATAEWADPALVEETYAYRDGTIWLGRSASENQGPGGYLVDRHRWPGSGLGGGGGRRGGGEPPPTNLPTLRPWPGRRAGRPGSRGGRPGSRPEPDSHLRSAT